MKMASPASITLSVAEGCAEGCVESPTRVHAAGNNAVEHQAAGE